jgi:hypothetical protein
MTTHSPQCSWHCDQYEHECDCGASRPATLAWAEREVVAAERGARFANERLAFARKRLRDLPKSRRKS